MTNIEKALKLKSDLDILRPLSKEDELRIMQKFRLDWNYHSNHIEGNSLTYGETKALILHGITAQGKPLKDHFEITGHNKAINWVLDVVKEKRALTENFIRELHELILKESYEVNAVTADGQPTKKKIKVGQYKSSPNHVKTKTGEIFRFASPEETPAMMNDLINWFRIKSTQPKPNPILIASEFHYKFIRIHPFDDGNGRIARILMNFILLQFGFPPIVIKTEDKPNYFMALQQADAGSLIPFIDYIAINSIQSLNTMILGAKGENVEEPDDIDKEIALLEQEFKSRKDSFGIIKKKEITLRIFNDFVFPLVKKFIEKSQKFNGFYNKNQFVIIVNSEEIPISEKDLKSIRNNINEFPNSIALKYNHTNFKSENFKDFHFSSLISCEFGAAEFKLETYGSDFVIEKLYSETLSESEITELVNSEIKRHKSKIETLLDE